MHSEQQLARGRWCFGVRSRTVTAALLALLAVNGVSPNTTAGWDNTDRYQVLTRTFRLTAPPGDTFASGLAGVAIGTTSAPITLTNYDTPHPTSFDELGNLYLIAGPKSGGLIRGGPCTIMGVKRGILTDIADYMRVPFANFPTLNFTWPACATNTHLMYNELLQAVRTCGRRCFVDIASL